MPAAGGLPLGHSKSPSTRAPPRCPLRSGISPTLNTVPRGKLATVIPSRAIAADPPGWLAAQQQRSAEWDALVRREQPLPAIAGRVDAISNVQQSVLAAGLDYWPRPTIQENMTVTPALIERNRAFFEGPEAPDTLIFAPGATDRRHPASVEGALWPLFLAGYAVSARERDQLILTRRATPLSIFGNLIPVVSRIVGTISITWWNWGRIPPLSLIRCGHEITRPLRVPPKCEATCFVHWNGVSSACAQATG